MGPCLFPLATRNCPKSWYLSPWCPRAESRRPAAAPVPVPAPGRVSFQGATITYIDFNRKFFFAKNDIFCMPRQLPSDVKRMYDEGATVSLFADVLLDVEAVATAHGGCRGLTNTLISRPQPPIIRGNPGK